MFLRKKLMFLRYTLKFHGAPFEKHNTRDRNTARRIAKYLIMVTHLSTSDQRSRFTGVNGSTIG